MGSTVVGRKSFFLTCSRHVTHVRPGNSRRERVCTSDLDFRTLESVTEGDIIFLGGKKGEMFSPRTRHQLAQTVPYREEDPERGNKRTENRRLLEEGRRRRPPPRNTVEHAKLSRRSMCWCGRISHVLDVRRRRCRSRLEELICATQ